MEKGGTLEKGGLPRDKPVPGAAVFFVLKFHIIGNDTLVDVVGVKPRPTVFLVGHYTNELVKLLLISIPDSFGPPPRVEQRPATSISRAATRLKPGH